MLSLARRFTPLILVPALTWAAPVHAQLLAYDGFGNGPLGDLAGSVGGTGWTSAWSSTGTDVTEIAGPGLTYPSLTTTHGGAVTMATSSSWPNTLYDRSFPAPPAGTLSLYVAFLLRADSGHGSWGGLSFGQYPYRMTVGSPLGMYAFGLMTSRGLGDISNRQLVVGETVLAVVKISRNASVPGITYRLFLDPVIGAGEPSTAIATFGLSGLTALPTALSLDNGTGFTTDELRVGTTWDAVVPAQVLTWRDLGFGKPGVNGAPRLVGIGPLMANTSSGVALSNAKPLALSVMVLGTQAVNAPFLGGVLVPDPASITAMPTDAAGSASLLVTWPAGIPAGLPLVFQFLVADPVATFGCAASNGLRGVTQ